MPTEAILTPNSVSTSSAIASTRVKPNSESQSAIPDNLVSATHSPEEFQQPQPTVFRPAILGFLI